MFIAQVKTQTILKYRNISNEQNNFSVFLLDQWFSNCVQREISRSATHSFFLEFWKIC